MVILSINDLKAGMILAESVYNQQELILLEKDTALTQKRIWMLKTWGIDQVCVKGKAQEDDAGSVEAGSETKETIEKELNAKFRDVIDDPVMKKIMKAAGKQLQKRLSDHEAQNKSA